MKIKYHDTHAIGDLKVVSMMGDDVRMLIPRVGDMIQGKKSRRLVKEVTWDFNQESGDWEVYVTVGDVK